MTVAQGFIGLDDWHGACHAHGRTAIALHPHVTSFTIKHLARNSKGPWRYRRWHGTPAPGVRRMGARGSQRPGTAVAACQASARAFPVDVWHGACHVV